MIEWSEGGKTSKDGQWKIKVERSNLEPVWMMFESVPEIVSAYSRQFPGDTDAWLGIYTEDLDEMHQQAEKLLKIVGKRRHKA